MIDEQHQASWPPEQPQNPFEGDPTFGAGSMPDAYGTFAADPTLGTNALPSDAAAAGLDPLAMPLYGGDPTMAVDPMLAGDPMLGAMPDAGFPLAGDPLLDPTAASMGAAGMGTSMPAAAYAADPLFGASPLPNAEQPLDPNQDPALIPLLPPLDVAGAGGTGSAGDVPFDPALGPVPAGTGALTGDPLLDGGPWGPGGPPFDPMMPMQSLPPWAASTPLLLPGPADQLPPSAYAAQQAGQPGQPGQSGQPPHAPGAPFAGMPGPWGPPLAPMPRRPQLTNDSLPSIFPENNADGAGHDPDADHPSDTDEAKDAWLEDTGPDPRVQLPSKLQSVIVEVAMVGLVLSIIAVAAAWLPDFSMLATIVAIISMPFGIVALIGTLKKDTRGRWMSIASLALAVIAIVVAIFTQTFAAPETDVAAEVAAERASLAQGSPSSAGKTAYSQGSSFASSAFSSADRTQITAWSSAAPHVDSTQGVIVDDATDNTEDWAIGNNLTDLPIGTPAEYAADLAVSVDTVTPGLVNYDGTAVTCVTVMYTNLSSTPQTYHQYDWTAQSSSGNDVSPCYYTNAQSELGTSEIAPGTSVAGNIYFQGKLSRVIFTPTGSGITSQDISWLVK